MCRFGYKYLVFIAFILITLFKINLISYAGVWVESEEGWYYTKDNGSLAKSEILLDDSGEIYCFDDNGLMLHDRTNQEGLYFGTNGAWKNPNNTNKQKFDDLWKELTINDTVTFMSKSEVADALNYYSYCKFITIPTKITVVSSDGNYILNSSSLENDLKILNKYSLMLYSISASLKANDDISTITNIVNYIVELGEYDTSESQNSAYTILNSGLGCCTGYSQLFNILCNNLGYTSETIFVSVITGSHCINRVLINDVWHYYDVTFYDSSKNDIYLDINKDVLLQTYKLCNKGIFGDK